MASGGSSALNFCAWTKPHITDVDAWEKLGNPGWNWELFQRHALRVESFTAATKDQLAEFPKIHHNIASAGRDGPIQTTVPYMHTAVDRLFMDTLDNLGVPDSHDPYNGNVNGKWICTNILDRKNKWTRSYAATAYYLPNKDKPNLKVLTSAQVSKILFSDVKDGEDIVATGVEFIFEGKKYVVYANKEVILAAGTKISPAILERSGIGRKDILDKIGVPVKVNLPGVGENVQDHIYAGQSTSRNVRTAEADSLLIAISYELKPQEGLTTFDILQDPEFAKEQARLQELDKKNMHRMGITSISYHPLRELFPDYTDKYYEGVASTVADAKKSNTLAPGLEEQYNIQLQIQHNDAPDFELIALPAFLTYLACNMPPAPIHWSYLKSTRTPSKIRTVSDLTTFDLEVLNPHARIDLEILVKGFRFIRRMAETEPFKSGIVREVDPGVDQTSDEQLRDYIRKTASTVHHPIGSLSMLPREKNGCVDTKLKVYGTKNVRVADISVVPLHVASHTQSVAYVLGDILGDILKTGCLE
ncbi:hypothetical protein EIP86_009148 [Pleurotus ostreatoroseus]|nr:hypothetical protein EIP86_009148 [Pleurotus ostreatoroseus]